MQGDDVTVAKEDWSEIEALLDAALECAPAEREAFVRGHATSEAHASEVLSLLASIEASSDFLEPHGDDTPAPLLEAGEQLGAWRIDALIGQGGMGDVYRVQRADGLYEQEAALKLMKPLSAEYADLFASERQFLARLDHPGIARLLDGGITAEGRPWMVMEYASGMPIDAWQRQSAAEPRKVVALMMGVCSAIADAHAKLIVHRDIKPSNIIVDDTGRSRVIDFGVAQLAGPQGAASLPLSIEFAAPELLAGENATTASDVYSLAACLYALLAGRAPLQLSGDPLAVAVRRADEELPPPLSDHLAPAARTAFIRDLSSILMRALQKRPEDRYRTVESFCDDLDRALQGKAVSTRQAERGYRAARFLRRHMWQAGAAAALVLSLAAGLGVSLWQARIARAEREVALSEQRRLESVQQYLYFMLRDAADVSGGTASSARDILETAAERVEDMFAADPSRGGPVMHALAELYLYLGDYEAAAPLLRRVAASEDTDGSVRAAARYDLAQYYLRTAKPDEAEAQLALAQNFWNQDPVRWHRRLVDSRLVEARVLRDHGKVDDAIALLRANLPERIRLSGESHRDTGVYHNDLGVLLNTAGRREEAVVSLQAALRVWQAISLTNSPDALNTLNNLAAIKALSGQYDSAEPLFRRAVQIRRDLYGPSAATAALLSNYGKTLLRLNRAADAVPLLREAVAMARDHAGPTSMHYASATAGLSEALSASGAPDQGLSIATRGYEELSRALGDAHPATAVIAIAMARELAGKNAARAAALLDRAELALKPLGAGAQSQIDAIAEIRTRYALRTVR